MLRTELTHLITAAVSSLVTSGQLPEAALSVPVEISDTKQPEHGDYACNFAMMASKKVGMNPRQVGDLLLAELLNPSLSSSNPDLLQSVEVAGPGFLNLRLNSEAIATYVEWILERGSDLPKSQTENPLKINIEFVSVNPNGPITVGSGRGAAFGDTLSRVLAAAGNSVDKEYYINDGVNSEQMRLFAESVKALATGTSLPDNGYKGDYVKDVATAVMTHEASSTQELAWFQKVSQELMIERQRQDLHQFGVDYQRWFSEQTLHDSGKVEEALKFLEDKGNAYWAEKPEGEQEPDEEGEESGVKSQGGEALWLRSKQFGDDKDRVLKRADGRPTYLAADIAYMKDKFERGYDKQYVVLGPDHHGYIGRMNAVCQALGYRPDQFEIVIFQIVRFMKDGKPAPMRKRDGNIYELRDLIGEIGADVTRFFYLMRSHETHMDFDIDLAKKSSDENPVFYAQYAHARICSVIAKAEEQGFEPSLENLDCLKDHRELALIKKALDLPYEVRRCAEDYGVHRLTTYAVELARAYHHFYDGCRVIQAEEPELTRARLALCDSVRLTLKCTFDLLGIGAPEKM